MMMLSTLSALLLSSLASVAQAQYPNPGACSGECFTHDPAVVKRADGKYFRFSTLDLIGISTADDLSGPWTRSGSVIQGASVINLPGNKELWAPDVVYIRGIYYCFYSVSTSGSRTSAIGYATSTTLEAGSWKDQGIVVTSSDSSPYNAIDPNVVNGTGPNEWYLQWGSYWNNIYQARVAINGEFVFRSGNEHQIAYEPEGIHQMEGAFIWKRDNLWYQFLSKGICCVYHPDTDPIDQVYHITVCRSDNPAGPYVDKDGRACTNGGGTTVLASHGNIYAPGGQGVFHDDAHGDVLYYHYLDLNVGVDYPQSKFGWNVINWVDGWPTI
ncbi:glycoside hydrolase family 43 protein [Daldinia caldariorum]|uniref:glycoside hydrolase family 43 protein n=1 Tax=Daldinia caldariorum TaxID=326644 RepID=UPI0020072D8E|nr:glycoside hydrolase family 43 protein [Daldinia caldariorum]KAI1464432.1 glycoside hydrolase family 43 protein [Daldinia caldariorum]